MKLNKRISSSVFLILGIAFFAAGLATNNTTFTWIAIALLFISLFLGGRWLRPRRWK
jgi:putative exporter of polyketide antibiotics